VTPLAPQLAEWVAGLRREDVPEPVIDGVRDRLIDTVGVAVAGVQSDAGLAARAVVERWAGVEESTVLGETRRLPAEGAALVNGTYAHSLDFDDTHLPSIVHPSAPLLAAVLAQAEAVGAGAEDTALAALAGYEVLCRVAMAQYDPDLGNSVMFEHGFHATSIIGALAAATACARLLRLDEEGIANAIAIAGSVGSGIIEANRGGGSVKPFHGGWAAHGGIVAARLAAERLTGPASVLEGRFGFFEAFSSGRWRPGEVTRALGSDWLVLEIVAKPYPCNHFTHCVVDAALALKARGLRPEDVRSVRIGTAEASWRTIGDPIAEKRRPRSPHHARFSAPFVFAAALSGGGGLGLTAEDFTMETIADQARLALADRCEVVVDDECSAIFPRQFPARVDVVTSSGEELTEWRPSNRGGPAFPLTREELRVKLESTAGDRADALSAACERFDVSGIFEAAAR
jgi:2-methylcitrate dehydratase PrpD